MEKNSRGISIAALIIALGMLLGGAAVGTGFYFSRNTDRFVTVKGLAEREVDADLAIWPITFRVTGDELDKLQEEIGMKRGIVTGFLREAGFSADEISSSAPKINDTRTDDRYRHGTLPEKRYIANTTITIRSANVPLVKKTMESAATLVGRGVAIAAENWETPTEFLFMGLNSIKPEMIEEATKNAREAAEKFALDSGSKVGKIRRATQGYFSITDRDRNSPDKKQVRVVTTVEYFLVD